MPPEDNEAQGGLLQGDGSIDDAVAAMPDLGSPSDKAAKVSPAGVRDDKGRYAGKTKPAEKVAAADPAADPKAEKVAPLDPEKLAADPDAEDDDDWIELDPEEEGGQPQRHKLSEVYAGYQEAARLKAELEQLRAQPPAKEAPEDYDRIVADTIVERQRYADAAQKWLQFQNPQKPPLEMLNPQSSNYDPDRYYALTQQFEAQVGQMRRVHEQLKQVEDANQKQQSEIATRQFEREKKELLTRWPEIKEPAVQQELKSFLSKTYGIGPDVLERVVDHRLYLLGRDAMAYAKAQAKAESSVKVVKAKPRLVPSASRQTAKDLKSARLSDSMSKLQKSGSIEDAAEALGGLLN